MGSSKREPVWDLLLGSWPESILVVVSTNRDWVMDSIGGAGLGGDFYLKTDSEKSAKLLAFFRFHRALFVERELLTGRDVICASLSLGLVLDGCLAFCLWLRQLKALFC